MNTVISDDRTIEQKQTHNMGIIARDKFMSGWGGAAGGASRCAWAYNSKEIDSDKLLAWIESRPEMRNIFATCNLNKYRPPRSTAHFHIYIAGQKHSSQK